jgi:anaerobic selenocysteine-containing dehydrogenase
MLIKKNEELVQNKDVKKPLTYRLLTPQSLLKIHSQYEMLPWLNQDQTDDFIELSPATAKYQEIVEGMKIEVFNEVGAITCRAKINPTLPNNVVLAHQAGSNPINKLITQPKEQDLHESSMFFYDSTVKIRKWRDKHV